MKNLGFAMVLIILLSSSVLVSAFGVSSLYYEGNPLKLNAGESRTVVFLLQNMVGDRDYTATAEITEGGEIARIIDSNATYFVPLGRKDIAINVSVTIPKSADEGDRYRIVLEVTAAPGASSGQIALAQGVGTVVPVEVIGKERRAIWPWILGTILVILLLIIYIIVRKHLKKRNVLDYG